MEQLLLLLTRIRIALRSCAAQLADSQQARLLQMIADMLDEGHLDGMHQATIFGFITYSYHPEVVLPMRKAFELRDIQRQSFSCEFGVALLCHWHGTSGSSAARRSSAPVGAVPWSRRRRRRNSRSRSASAASRQRAARPGAAPCNRRVCGDGPLGPSLHQARNGTAVVATMAACPVLKSVGEVSLVWTQAGLEKSRRANANGQDVLGQSSRNTPASQIRSGESSRSEQGVKGSPREATGPR